MPERSVDQIREEIAAEREGLREDVEALQGELRSTVPFVIGGLVAAALLALLIAFGVRQARRSR
jgi:hypothetical protein